MPHPVSKEHFEALVEKAIGELPAPFAGALEEMTVEVLPRPTRKQLRELGLGHDELLLGLYVGTPLPDRGVEDTGRLPDRIYIFKEDCELVSESEEQLVEEVRVTLLHELGHYFGMDEDELADAGYS